MYKKISIKDDNLFIRSYREEYTKLTTTFQKREPRLYDIRIIVIILRELSDFSCYPRKICKPTKTGTKITFEVIKDREIAKNKINERIIEYNKKYKGNITLFKWGK